MTRDDWPHAPVHRIGERGAYMVTAGTYNKVHHLHTPERRNAFQALLFTLSRQTGWDLQAWAVMTNHYHFVAVSPQEPESLRQMLAVLHHDSSVSLNAADAIPLRRVWYQYFDTHLTYQRSYLARLRYVHTNPVHHGVVRCAEDYPWCSMLWFQELAGRPFQQTLAGMRTDRVRVFDDF